MTSYVWVLFEIEKDHEDTTQLVLKEVFTSESKARKYIDNLKTQYKLREFQWFQEHKTAGAHIEYHSVSGSRGTLCINIYDIKKNLHRESFFEFETWWNTLSADSVLSPEFDNIYSMLYEQPVFELICKELL